jgi:hypothetical protein
MRDVSEKKLQEKSKQSFCVQYFFFKSFWDMAGTIRYSQTGHR